MKEKSVILRKHLYSLLSFVHFYKKDDYEACIKVKLFFQLFQIILENLRIYPDDKNFIFELVKKLSQNNSEFLHTDYINKLLNLDPNLLIQEFNWNDLEYSCKLIIVQEIIKSKNYAISISLPKFLPKHFNYLSNKYPRIYDKSFLNYLMHIKIDHCSKSICEADLHRTVSYNTLTKSFKFEDNFDEICSFFQKSFLSNLIIVEFYQKIFSFMKLLKTEKNFDILKIIVSIKNILSILSKINFQIRLNSEHNLDNVPSSFHKTNKSINLIFLLNEAIGCFMLQKLLDYSGLQSTTSFMAFMKEIRKRLESDLSFFGFFNSIFDNDDGFSIQEIFENFLSYLGNNYSEFLKTSIISIKITNPKNNFNYMHTKEKAGLNFPFFLSISIKISNFISNLKTSGVEIKIAKSLLFQISKLSDTKLLQIEPSDIKLLESENIINIKSKIPVYIDDNESNDYILNIVTKSELKRELVSIIRRLNLPMEIKDSIALSEDINFIIY